MAREPIVRLISDDWYFSVGSPSTRQWVEARALSRGFSIIVGDSEVFPRGVRRYVDRRPYSWRRFALALCGLSNRDWTAPPAEVACHVDVWGEEGIIGDILALAYASGDNITPPLVRFLVHQDDASLDILGQIFASHLDQAAVEILWRVADEASILEQQPALGPLITATNENGIEALQMVRQRLEPKIQAKRASLKIEREAFVATFREAIEAIVMQFDDTRPRAIGWMSLSPRQKVRHFLENYVVTHRSLPQGRVRVRSDRPPLRYDLGEIDVGFDKKQDTSSESNQG